MVVYQYAQEVVAKGFVRDSVKTRNICPLAGRRCCWTGQFAVRGVDLIN